MYLKTLLPACLLITILCVACQDGNEQKSSDYTMDHLQGRWELKEAWRNQKKTELLFGTYYEFNASGKMKTNLTPSTQERIYDYELNGQRISQKSDPEVIYTIEELKDSLLTMSMIINNFPFRLKLKKQDLSANTPENGSETSVQ